MSEAVFTPTNGVHLKVDLSESASICCCNGQDALNQNMSLRYGVPGGLDGRPRPCPVGSWRRPGGHYHLLLVPRGS